MLSAIEQRYPQEQIESSAYQAQRAIEDESAIVVGVNRYSEEGGVQPPILSIAAEVETEQRARIAAYRASRDQVIAAQALAALGQAAAGSENLMEVIVSCVRASCTLGEISDALRAVFGEYHGQ